MTLTREQIEGCVIITDDWMSVSQTKEIKRLALIGMEASARIKELEATLRVCRARAVLERETALEAAAKVVGPFPLFGENDGSTPTDIEKQAYDIRYNIAAAVCDHAGGIRYF